MSLLHPNDDDEAFALSHLGQGFNDRVQRIKRLLAALRPFAEERETEADREEARACMREIKEWL